MQAALAKFTTADLTKAKILAAFRTGRRPRTSWVTRTLCDGKQLAGAPAICNAYQQIRAGQEGTSTVVASKDFVTPGLYYTGSRRGLSTRWGPAHIDAQAPTPAK